MMFSSSTFAQGLNNEVVKANMIVDWERAKLYTREYLDAMPEDGINFKPLTKAVLPSNKVGNPNTTWSFPVQTNTNEAIKKIRIKAINFGNCPKGHPGEGNPTFIFADEILFR